MKYLLLLNVQEDGRLEPGTPEWDEGVAYYRERMGALAEAGVLIDSAPLQPASVATTVRVRDGETVITDGPAAEIKEVLGGYTLVECANLDEALKWAATIPAAEHGSVEVRPVIGGSS